jgi:hypothetical protein
MTGRKINDSIDLVGNQINQVILENLAADPGTFLGDGRIWYDTVLDAVRVRANGATVSLASGMDSEAVQDIVGAMTVGGTESGITVSYDDTNARLDFTVTDAPLLGGQNGAYYLARGNHSGTQTASTISDFTAAATEVAQDVAGTIIGAGGIVVTYDDAGTGLTTLTLTNNEAFQDAVGGFFASGTGSSGITVTYDDVGNDLNFVVTDSPLLGGQNSAYHLARANHTGTQLFSTVTTSNTDKLLGRDTAAGGAVEEIALSSDMEFTGASAIRVAAYSGGDITKTAGATSATITANAVTTAKILDANVTLAKMANITTDSLIGRDTAASGVPEVITLDTTLVMNGSQVLGRAALTGDVTTSANAATIANSVVTNAKLANMAASSFKGNNTGGSAVALDLTTTQAKSLLAIANTDVSGLGTLATVSNLTGNVTSVGAATTIAAGVVTNAMQANMNANTVKMNNTGGATAPTDVTLANFKTWLALAATNISDFDTQVNTHHVHDLALATAALNMNTHQITGVVDPSNPQDAATKFYVDALIQGQTWKDPVDAATTAALPALTYSSGAGTLTETANAVLAAQDGITLAVGDSLLVKDQASSFQNGIYTVTAVGSGAAPFVLTRRNDADTAAELRDAAVMIESGTTLGGDIYTQTVSTLADLTAATQTWVKTGDTNTVYTSDGTTVELVGNSFRIAATAAGNGLSGGGGSALAVNVSTGLEINTDNVRIAAHSAGGLTGGAGSALAVNTGTGLEVSSNTVRIATAAAGNGLTGGGGSALTIDHTKVPLIYVVTLTGGAAFEDVTHNLGTKDVIVSVYNLTGAFPEEEFSVEHKTTNIVTIRSATTIPAATYRVVVFG